MVTRSLDYISPQVANNLYSMFCERVRRTPNAIAYRYYYIPTETWQQSTWTEMATAVACWQQALSNEKLRSGDRVAVMLRNCREWVMFDQAALSLGLVVVPLYTDDNPENISFIINDAEVKLLLVDGDSHWQRLYDVAEKLRSLQRIVSVSPMHGQPHDPRLRWLNDWLPEGNFDLLSTDIDANRLASIVYTSGTTGKPKGVMLSHRNMLANAWSGLHCIDIFTEDQFLSFLPLSHTLERTVGYYLPIMAGACVNYARSISELAEDMLVVRPTIIITVPRIFERVYNKIQAQLPSKPKFSQALFRRAVEIGWSRFQYKQRRLSWQLCFLFFPLFRLLVSKKILEKFGGRLRLAVSGGAALPLNVAKVFIGLGVNINQGYGLTEASPIISVNRIERNDPASVGETLPQVEVKIGEGQELLAKGPNVMLGYWQQPDATKEVIDDEGWLHTGDKADIVDNHIYITGRLKDIIVMSNGEKVPPNDMETAITLDPIFEQALVIGEAKPYLSAIVVLNWDRLKEFSSSTDKSVRDQNDVQEKFLLERISSSTCEFPGYAQVRRVAISPSAWTIDNELMTPSLKLRRQKIMEKYQNLIDSLYDGH